MGGGGRDQTGQIKKRLKTKTPLGIGPPRLFHFPAPGQPFSFFSGHSKKKKNNGIDSKFGKSNQFPPKSKNPKKKGGRPKNNFSQKKNC